MVKKINKIWTFLFAFTFCILGLAFICLPDNANSNVYAEGENEYFSVTQYSQYDPASEEGNIVATIADGGVAYASLGHAVVVNFSSPNGDINVVTSSILYNGTSYTNEQLESFGIIIDYGIGDSFRLTSQISNSLTPYGKYELVLNYILTSDGVQTNQRITYTFYIVQNSNYYSGTAVSTIISNAYPLNAPTYDRAYQYQYQYEGSNQLPTLIFDKTNIQLSITKTFQQITTTQTITYDGQNLISSGDDVVIVVESNDSNLVTLYFNDLGFYTINYNFTYVYGNNVDVIPQSTTNAIRRSDCIEIFGYQLFYSNVTTSSAEEFKTINRGIISNPTDVTYLSGNSFNLSLDNTEQTAIQNIVTQLENNSITIQSTNQQPVQFSYNVQMFTNSDSSVLDTQSGYWRLSYSNNRYIISDKHPFENSPFTSDGIYLLKVVYKNNSQIGGVNADESCASSSIGDGATEKLRVQWFLFEITSNSAQMQITSNGTQLLDGSYTKDVVQIQKSAISSVFDAQTRLEISFQANYTGSYTTLHVVEDGQSVQVDQNGNYIATMYYGKNLSRSYSSTFTIDTTPIENIQIFSVSSIDSAYYYRNSEIDFLTNQPICVSWNEKQSGSTITASYKYIPMVADTDANFTSSILREYQSYDGVPASYYFDYNGGDLTSINYVNTQNYDYIPAQTGSVLTQSGMYIFYLVDSAGNEQYFAFIIDTSENNILQEIEGEFVEPTDLNIISSDATIYWGQYKYIRFNNIIHNGAQFGGDAHLAYILNNTNIFQDYFSVLTINTQNTCFARIEIDQNVLLDRSDSNQPFFIPSEDIVNNSYTINFTTVDENGEVVALENDYLFYTRDASNTKTLAGLDEISVENYLTNYSGSHIVRVSSDASQTILSYTSNNSTAALIQDSYSPVPHVDTQTGYNQKDKYYRPTNVSTLSDSSEILTLLFNATPEEGVVEVSSMTYTFSPFTAKQIDGTNVYTYVFEQPSDPVVIYSKANPSQNLATLTENGQYAWQVNREYVPSGPSGYYRTRAGKYTITRVYDMLSSTQDRINDTYDYMIRTFTFVIDRNGVITTPSVVDSTGNTFSYVGESIKLQVLEDEEDRMFFKDIFLAENDPNGENVILTTNKLPVFVYVPAVKYGYSIQDGATFNTENTINSWANNSNDETLASTISSYALSAEIKYSYERSTLEQSTTIYRSSGVSSDGYLIFNDTVSGRSFTQVGFYKVTIRQGYYGYGNVNQFSFVFEITENEPSFNIVDPQTNAEYESNSGTYYTNDSTVRLSWSDPENQFMAKIDSSQITYQVNGVTYNVPESDIVTSGLNHYVDINLLNISGAFVHNNYITFNMQYEGRESDYNEGQFRASRTLCIDIVAPTANIDRLIALNGISQNLVRNVQERYNTSVSAGLYRYYSFAVDVSQIESIIDLTSHTNGEAYTILYRFFETVVDGRTIYTKYNDIYTQETSVTAIENSTNNFTRLDPNSLSNIISNLSTHTRPYIEIVEIDMAGNITVYTIYLTNVENLAQTQLTPITFENNATPDVFLYSDLNYNIDVFAKSSFVLTGVDMMGFDWNQITVNGVSYLKTPYSNGSYYNLATYNSQNPSLSEIPLSQFARLSASTQKQNITISYVPYYTDINLSCSVLNTSLSVMHTSTTSAYQNEEGILIRIPATSSAQDATIYATNVEIVQYVRNQNNEFEQRYVYSKNSDTYFASMQTSLDISDLVTSTYVTYMGSTYLKIIITSPTNNRYYRYYIQDNFGDSYSFSNIYGSEIIENELTSEVPLVENYENGTSYYYSTKSINFSYNIEKDIVLVTATTSSAVRSFNLSNDSDRTLFESLGYGRVLISSNGIVHTIVFNAPRQDMVEGVVGGEITFSLNIYEAFAEISTGMPYRTINLRIYNIIPRITLLDSSNNSQNNLFNHDTMYGNEIRIMFEQTTGRIPCLVFLEYEDGTITQINSGFTVSEPQTYSIIIRFQEIFTDRIYDIYLDFTISDNDEDFYQVVYHSGNNSYVASPTGNSFTFTQGNIQRNITTHYILNTDDFEIVYNTEQDIQITEPEIIPTSGYTTYIYTISNRASQTATVYFERTIAITIIPATTNILSRFSHYNNEGTLTNFSTTGTVTTFAVSVEESNTSYKRIAWQSYYGIPENYITVTVYFGDNQTVYNPRLSTENGLTTMTLSSSGTYYLTFKDVAGNVHMFTALENTYTIRYLRSVIYYANGQSPINNAVYDDTVTITIPESTLSYYDQNAQPRITVLKNGESYTPTSDRYNRTFTFNEAGLYRVSFSAAITDTQTGTTTNINEEPLYFLIIRPNESRWSMEFSQYANYYVERVIKDGQDITDSITNENMGQLVYKQVTNADGTTSVKAYLANLLISMNDAVTGAGHYTITINCDNEFGQNFTYSFWINDATPPIQVSIEENQSTTDPITVSFNTQDLLNSVGDCILRIAGMDDFILSSQRLADGQLQTYYTFTIQASGTYDIQLLTESGRLLYSYRVTKTEPLNTVSIILIVVSCLVVVGLTVMFILLRKRMKIR